MNNPYSNEWGKINKLAKDIRTLLDKIEELRSKAAKIQEQIARIPYREDENGNDVNAGRRDELYAKLESINALIEETNETRAQLSAEAMQLSGTYQTQAEAYDEKAQKAAGAKGGFDRLSGYRFGASTAAVAAKASGQREEHYQSYVRILQELSSAAQSAANGILIEKGTQTVSERGKFINPNKIGSGNSTERQDIFEQRRWKGAPGDSIRLTNNTENSALLSNLNMEGLPYQNGNPDFTSVSHAVVPVAGVGVATMLAADAMLAKRYGITADEIAEYRKENELEWRDDGTGTGYLVPRAISEEYNEGRTETIQPSAPDALTAYMWAHNYGKDDYAIYSKDPEWQKIHREAFPEYYNNKPFIDHQLSEYEMSHEEKTGWVKDRIPGISIDESEQIITAMEDYSVWDYKAIHQNEESAQDKINSILRIFDADTTPIYQGTIHRGLSFDSKQEVLESLFTTFGVWEEPGITSFSSNIEIAKQFARYGDWGLVLTCENNKSGIPFKHMSKVSYEDEILSPGDARGIKWSVDFNSIRVDDESRLVFANILED